MDPLEKIIQTLQLKPHPEGGYYRETYRSAGEISQKCLDADYSGKRNHSTCIYHLLTSDNFSAFHRLVQDEIWHFYDGSPITLHLIYPLGAYSKVIIGRNIEEGQVPQFIIPGGTWFAANISGSNVFSLIGCTVAPGFDFADFEMGSRDNLLNSYPQHREVIVQLTRE